MRNNFLLIAAAAICWLWPTFFLSTVNGFAPSPSHLVGLTGMTHPTRRTKSYYLSTGASTPSNNLDQNNLSNPSNPTKITSENNNNNIPLTHANIEWRLRPPEETSFIDRWKIKLGAKAIRWDLKLRGEEMPPILCPRGGRALLEAYYREPGKGKIKIGRFGITTARGPSCDEIDTTIREIYQINPPQFSVGIAAIVYMFVEPEYRNRNVGALALEVISAIHAVQGVDFTVLVADDNGSGGLVKWYEQNGYSKAPLMQHILGSPGGQFGVSMICPVRVEPGFFDRCLIKWW